MWKRIKAWLFGATAETKLVEVEIEVTSQHIIHGVQEDPWYCPVALALVDVLPFSDIAVNGTYIDIDGNTYYNGKAANFITNFDFDRNSVEPFTFTLFVRE